MTLGNISLFAGLGARMDYLNTRQTIIAQNIANANTPGYIPQDLKPMDFGSLLDAATNSRSVSSPQTTSASHMSGGNSADGKGDFKKSTQRSAYDVTPSGNAVVIEEQMMKAGDISMDYSLMTNIYQKNVSMIRMALGGH